MNLLVMDPKFHGNLLFKDVSADELDDLEIAIRERQYNVDDIVFEEGDGGEHVYLIAEGSVRISKKGRGGKQETLAVQKAGGFFGEMALLDGQKRSARVTAAEPTTLGLIDREGLDSFLNRSTSSARHFMQVLMQQLRTANSKFIKDLIDGERLALVGTMMSSIVHDFRNPIATIGMVSHYLENQSDPTLNELGALSQAAIDQMQTMIQELLDYSRGTSKVQLEPTTVRTILEDLDQQILRRLRSHGTTVDLQIDYEGDITVDRVRIMRLLLNIVKNAEEAMPQSGTITIATSEENGEVAIVISDTGCGIHPEIMATIFDPFVTYGKSKGTGLGMAIAKSVVEAHRGKIWMESKEGEGTSCHIMLPVAPRPS